MLYLPQMKKISWLLIAILAVACDDDEPKDPVVNHSKVAEFLGEYQGIHRLECNDTPNCALWLRDGVVLVTEGKTDSTIAIITDSTVTIMDYEVQIDKDGKFFCCENFDMTIENDTLKISKNVRITSGTYGIERFIGVKNAKSPLKVGSVGFHSATSEVSENGPYATLVFDIEGAKLGAAILLEISNTSTAVPGKDYLIDNKSILTVGPNITSATLVLTFLNDFVPTGSRTIHLQISAESVGVIPSEKKNHSITILEDDVAESSINKILFRRHPENQLFDINSDGTGVRQRTDLPGGVGDASFSPDGNSFVFSSVKDDGKYGIYTMNFNGGEMQRLTKNDWGEGSPSFSPQGDKILFVRDLQNYPWRSQIFTMNLDGSEATQISHVDNGAGTVAIEDPSWSPDGKQIIYTCDKDNEGMGYRIYIMNADGSNTRRLTDKFRWERRPRFSPDGKKIIFTIFEPGIGVYLFLINSDGTGEEKLFSGIPGLIRSEDAAWSPDGSTVVFWAEIEGNPELTSGTYTARIDGADFKMLTPIRMHFPSWSPAK